MSVAKFFSSHQARLFYLYWRPVAPSPCGRGDALGFPRKRFAQRSGCKTAGDEARTRDVHLGKVVLYQLSYTRI